MSRKRWILLAVVGTVAGGVLVAQGLRQGMHAPGPMHELIAGYLDLTDAQKEQAKSIFQAARQAAQPVVEQLRQGHEAVAAAVKSGASDQQLQQLADRQGTLVGQLAGIHAKAFAKFYAILTPEQKAKADKLHERFKEAFRQRLGRAFGHGPGAI